MEYQKIINLLDNPLHQPSKFKAKYRVEIIMIRVERITPLVKSN